MLRKDILSESFFEELKRRKVIRIATTYIVIAWVLIQVSDVVSEPLGIPLWIQTALIIALIALFPVALVLAWLYDITSKGIVRDSADVRNATPSVAPAAATDRKINRIAVLPLVDLSPGANEESQLFCDGISEEIINRIAGHKELRVIARTSSFRFRGSDIDLAAIRHDLNATHLITGSVRRSGDINRISVQLIETHDNSQIWADAIQTSVDEPFETQAEVARLVDNAMVSTLDVMPTAESHTWKLSPAAQEQYLVARDAFWRADFPAVLKHADESNKIDPHNPLVPTLIAQVYLVWPRYGFSVTQDELRLAGKNVANALRIDPHYPGAHAARGMLSLFLERDFRTAFEVVTAAAIRHPSVAEWVPQLLVYANRYKEAIELHRRIAQRDPLNPTNLLVWANRVNWMGQKEVAKNICKWAEDIDPEHLILKNNVFRWAIRDGDLEKARSVMSDWGMDPDQPETEPNIPWVPRSISLWLGSRLFGETGDSERAYSQAQEIEKLPGFTPTTVAEAYINAGAIDDAYRIWDLGISQYDLGVYDLAQPPDMREPDDPLWLKFRNDSRYEECLERLGLDQESLQGIDWNVALQVLQP